MLALADALAGPGTEITVGPADPLQPPPGHDLVVVDSYRLRADELDGHGARVVAVDDLERDLAVDVVIDPCPGAQPDPHRRAGVVLAGADYLLLDPALADRPPPPLRADVTRVLVTVGATATDGLATRLAQDLRGALDPNVGVALVIGPWSDDHPPDGVDAVRTADGLVDELAAADLVVTAAGVTLLESLALGRPTVAFVTAENQRRAAAGVRNADAAVITEADHAVGAVLGLAADPERRAALAAAGRILVDGRGAARAAAALLAAIPR